VKGLHVTHTRGNVSDFARKTSADTVNSIQMDLNVNEIPGK